MPVRRLTFASFWFSVIKTRVLVFTAFIFRTLYDQRLRPAPTVPDEQCEYHHSEEEHEHEDKEKHHSRLDLGLYGLENINYEYKK